MPLLRAGQGLFSLTDMATEPLFKRPAIVLLLLSELPGTSAGLHRRAQAFEPDIPVQSVYHAALRLKQAGLIRHDGDTVARRGGGKRYVLTDAGRAMATRYRRSLAVAASLFPAEDMEVEG